MRTLARFRLGSVLLAGVCVVAGDVRGQETSVNTTEASVTRESAPRVFYTQAGQFEIIVQDVADAQPALALGRSVWDALAEPLGLPAEGFNTPVSVRLVPADQWTDAALFTVTAEPPGRVVVRVRWSAKVEQIVVRRAFVQGLILRQAVAWHGIGGQLTVPLWLEQACAQWSMVLERPSMHDAFQQESRGIPDPPTLRALLSWQRGEVESRGWELASLWLFLQLREEADQKARWGGWVRGVLGGAPAFETLPRFHPELWADASAMELWWQVGFYHQIRRQIVPMLTAEASRAWLANRSRWLAGRGGREVVLTLSELPDVWNEPWIRTELNERIAQTRAMLGLLHPFYANTALSMGRLYEAAAKRDEQRFKQALAEFQRDALDGRELEDTVKAILDTAPRD